MNAIKLISAEAKKIQKDHPRLSWQDCIRQASQIYKLKKRKISGIKTRATKSAPSKPSKIKSRGSYTVKSALSSGMSSIAGIRKKRKTAAPKMKAVKRKPATRSGTHTDTKSHNVRISVMSGVNNTLNRYRDTLKEIEDYKDAIYRMKKSLPSQTVAERVKVREIIKKFTKIVSVLKSNATQLKKLI